MNFKKVILVEPMSEYANVMQEKMPDTWPLTLKAQTWDKLSRERNDIHGVRPGEAKEFTKLWKNLKGK